MSEILHHLTLLTGNLISHRIDTFSPDTVRACADLLPAGGTVPGLDAFRVEISNGSIFTIYRGAEPIVTCGIGEAGESGEEMWNALIGLQERFAEVKASKPKRGQWLAVVILPFIQNLTKSDIDWLADFERCLAAAMILDREKT